LSHLQDVPPCFTSQQAFVGPRWIHTHLEANLTRWGTQIDQAGGAKADAEAALRATSMVRKDER
jgi:hypothetical protein